MSAEFAMNILHVEDHDFRLEDALLVSLRIKAFFKAQKIG